MSISALQAAIDFVYKGLASFKAAKDLLPDSREKEMVAAALEQAEQNFKIAEAQAAQELGYQICRCKWPPVIMLEKKRHHWICDACGGEVDTTPHVGVVRTKSSLRKSLDHY